MLSNSKSCMGFLLAYTNLTLNYAKGKGHGHAHFDCKYLGNGDRFSKNYYCHQIASHVWAFYWYIYI